MTTSERLTFLKSYAERRDTLEMERCRIQKERESKFFESYRDRVRNILEIAKCCHDNDIYLSFEFFAEHWHNNLGIVCAPSGCLYNKWDGEKPVGIGFYNKGASYKDSPRFCITENGIQSYWSFEDDCKKFTKEFDKFEKRFYKDIDSYKNN